MASKIIMALVTLGLVSLAFEASSSSAEVNRGFFENGSPGFRYDCSGKADGSYPHPTKCTHYVTCVAMTTAYESVCASNDNGKPLHYVAWSGPDPVTSRCDIPEVAGCRGGCKLE